MLLDKSLTSLLREARGKPTYADSYALLRVHSESNIQHPNRKQKTWKEKERKKVDLETF